jgi:hypothetical protein
MTRRPMNPTILSEILETVRRLEDRDEAPTFNTILHELSSRGILKFHRTLRNYLDLLTLAELLSVKHEKTLQQNIREKQIYHVVAKHTRAIVEAGEEALLLHGLNWSIPSPLSVRASIDLHGLARSTVSGNKVYASLEDSIVESLRALTKRRSELVVFATALFATQKVDFEYLLTRAKETRVEKEILAILLAIDSTLSSARPNVEDVQTLYELRKVYQHSRRSVLRLIQAIDRQGIPAEIVSSNEVIEYAGKQLGIRG